ncbi:hypothetical protein [Candidatus Laterigemmans baculatus]|uniref:hypothetical protein n=1 Tax=Candidatus Laterigemmans baculatus TaxID=2770505 RepID=UPI0013DA8EFD|nr:hypothetical protein [Candidatus Laterigemmans baculatus]
MPQGVRLAVGGVLLAWAAALAVGATPGAGVWAAEPPVTETPLPPQTGSALELTSEEATSSVQSLAAWAVTQLPRVYEGDKDWGETKKVWAGVKVRFDGLKLKTNRRFRELRHGRWARYQLSLPAAEQGGPAVEIVIDRVHQSPDGRWQIEATITAPMAFVARVERWNLGVQWYSVSVEGDLRVRLRSTTTVGFYADYSEVPPALTVDPRVEMAELAIERFEVDRISKIGGDVAEELGDFLEDVFRDRLVEKENQRLATKLNKAIDKKRARLRWSLVDWFASH